MAFTMPTSIDGECLCRLCCKQTWGSVWDCDSSAWSAPAIRETETIAGPCPEDVDWAYDGGTSDPCDAIYIKYVALPDVCKTCDDASQTPPASPTLGEPSGCCVVDCVCLNKYQYVYDCLTATYVEDTSSSSCDTVDSLPVLNTPLQEDPNLCIITYYTSTLQECDCAQPFFCPSPPPFPDLGSEPPDGCCPCGLCYQISQPNVNQLTVVGPNACGVINPVWAPYVGNNPNDPFIPVGNPASQCVWNWLKGFIPIEVTVRLEYLVASSQWQVDISMIRPNGTTAGIKRGIFPQGDIVCIGGVLTSGVLGCTINMGGQPCYVSDTYTVQFG